MSDTADQGLNSRDDDPQHLDQPAQAVRREIWLDLEDTVITPVVEGWFKTELINIDKVRRVIRDFKPDAVHLFSFAIWDEQQREGFRQGTRDMLEKALGLKLQLILTVDTDIIPICCRQMGIEPSTVDFQEMSNFWSKQGAFRLCMRHHATNHRRHHPNLPLHVLLLDDVVYNEYTVWPDLQTTVEQWNIDQL